MSATIVDSRASSAVPHHTGALSAAAAACTRLIRAQTPTQNARRVHEHMHTCRRTHSRSLAHSRMRAHPCPSKLRGLRPAARARCPDPSRRQPDRWVRQVPVRMWPVPSVPWHRHQDHWVHRLHGHQAAAAHQRYRVQSTPRTATSPVPLTLALAVPLDALARAFGQGWCTVKEYGTLSTLPCHGWREEAAQPARSE